jgi:hypothetical protein
MKDNCKIVQGVAGSGKSTGIVKNFGDNDYAIAMTNGACQRLEEVLPQKYKKKGLTCE